MKKNTNINLEEYNFCELFKTLKQFFDFEESDPIINIVDFINHLLGRKELNYDESGNPIFCLQATLKYSTIKKYYENGRLLCTSNHAHFLLHHLDENFFLKYLQTICPDGYANMLSSFYQKFNITFVEDSLYKTTFSLIINSIRNCQIRVEKSYDKTITHSSNCNHSTITVDNNSCEMLNSNPETNTGSNQNTLPKDNSNSFIDNAIPLSNNSYTNSSNNADVVDLISQPTQISVIVGTDSCCHCKYWKGKSRFIKEAPDKIKGYCIIQDTQMYANNDICTFFEWG